MTYALLGSSVDDFRRFGVLFSWMKHTMPDAACSANRVAQIAERIFGKDNAQELKEAIKLIKNNVFIGLSEPRLDENSLQFWVYVDASYPTNNDLSSQLGYLDLLSNKSSIFHVLYFYSNNSKRAVTSIMTGETCASMATFDAATLAKKDLQKLTGSTTPLFFFMNSKQWFDAETKRKQTSKKRLMTDFTAARESYTRYKFDAIWTVRGCYNPADDSIMIKATGMLSQILHHGTDTTSMDHLFDRKIVQSLNNLKLIGLWKTWIRSIKLYSKIDNLNAWQSRF